MVEFVRLGDVANLGDFLSEIGFTPGPRPKIYGDAPDMTRVQTALDMFHEHRRQLDGAENAEIGMLTPRVTLREHDDMHLIMTALDEHMTKRAETWANAVAAYAIGNEENTLEDLQYDMRRITEAAILRRALDRVHTAWGVENAPDEVPEFNESDTDEG